MTEKQYWALPVSRANGYIHDRGDYLSWVAPERVDEYKESHVIYPFEGDLWPYRRELAEIVTSAEYNPASYALKSRVEKVRGFNKRADQVYPWIFKRLVNHLRPEEVWKYLEYNWYDPTGYEVRKLAQPDGPTFKTYYRDYEGKRSGYPEAIDSYLFGSRFNAKVQAVRKGFPGLVQDMTRDYLEWLVVLRPRSDYAAQFIGQFPAVFVVTDFNRVEHTLFQGNLVKDNVLA